MVWTQFHSRINGEWWLVCSDTGLETSCMGRCDFETRTISICSAIRERKLVDTVIHEALHASAPYLAEPEVERIATDLTGVFLSLLEAQK